MTFVEVIERETTITIDGYSNRKNIESAIKEMGRYIAKNIDKSEGNFIMNYPMESLLTAKDSCGGYFFEIEDAPCASNWNEEAEEMEYADGRWYICCRIVK